MWFEFTPSSIFLPPLLLTKIFFLVWNTKWGRGENLHKQIRIEYIEESVDESDQLNRAVLNRGWQLPSAVNCRNGTERNVTERNEMRRKKEKEKRIEAFFSNSSASFVPPILPTSYESRLCADNGPLLSLMILADLLSPRGKKVSIEAIRAAPRLSINP